MCRLYDSTYNPSAFYTSFSFLGEISLGVETWQNLSLTAIFKIQSMKKGEEDLSYFLNYKTTKAKNGSCFFF